MLSTRDVLLLAVAGLALGCSAETVPSHGAPGGSAAVRSATPTQDDSPASAAAGSGSVTLPPSAAGSAGLVPPTAPNAPAASVAAAKPNAMVSLPPATGAFDYQLSARNQPDARVRIISSNSDIDPNPSHPAPADQPLDKSRYNICYLNVFQTQAEDYNFWITSHPDLILKDAAGQPVHDPDPDWAGELLFDLSSDAKRTQLLALQDSWISGCAAAGFKAIEPDNLDAYERSLGAYSAADAQSYMQSFVAKAHAQGLAVAQKNAVDWISMPHAAGIGFDFAIIEECQLTGECDAVIAHYGAARVFEIEYVYQTDDTSSGVRVAANTSQHFDMACAARGKNLRIVLRDRDVRPSNEAGYVFKLCDAATAGSATTQAPPTTTTRTTTGQPTTTTPSQVPTTSTPTVPTGSVPTTTTPTLPSTAPRPPTPTTPVPTTSTAPRPPTPTTPVPTTSTAPRAPATTPTTAPTTNQKTTTPTQPTGQKPKGATTPGAQDAGMGDGGLGTEGIPGTKAKPGSEGTLDGGVADAGAVDAAVPWEATNNPIPTDPPPTDPAPTDDPYPTDFPYPGDPEEP